MPTLRSVPKFRSPDSRTERAFTALGIRTVVERIEQGLHIVATPIGNLGDVTLRALHTLAAADAILVEDTRVSRRLLVHYEIDTPLVPYHEHNAAKMRPQILAHLAKGESYCTNLGRRHPSYFGPGLQAGRRMRRCWS